MPEISTKPYLLRAIYDWCCDAGFTPYLAVVVDERTQVPHEHVVNGEIVLNVSPAATNHLSMGNELIEFQARFGGVARELSIPVGNVSAIYARENGHGMAFEVEVAPSSSDDDMPPAAESPVTRPALAAVPSPGSDDEEAGPGEIEDDAAPDAPDDPDDSPPSPRGRPQLRRVK